MWKIILCLREFRPELKIFTMATPPSGLGVISGLDPNSRVLNDRFEHIISRYLELEVDADLDRRRERAAIVDNDWQQAVALLPNRLSVIEPRGF